MAPRRERKPPLPKGAERFGAWFDHKAAEGAAAFFPTYLRHSEGQWAGRPFMLSPWQRQIVRQVFGWKRDDGTRLIRTVYIEVPRKNGKTEFAAGLALVLLVGDREMGGQVYSMAVDQDQARIAFNKAGTMVRFSRELAELPLEVFKTSIYCPALMAAFKPLSSAPSTKHGFSPSGVVADELHEWRDGELFNVVHEGMGARKQPLEVLITTAGVRGVGFGWEMHAHAEKVRDGVIVDPSFLPVIFAAGPDDDWTAPETWAKANPNLGVSLGRAFLEGECEKAKRSPRQENRFRRFFLNQWTEQVTRWLRLEDWDASAGALDWRALEAKLKGRACFGALDLGSTTDLTALALAFGPEAEGEAWSFVWRFFLPAERMKRRIEEERVPFDDWERAGALIATEGNITDYRRVRAEIDALAETFVIREIAYDPWNASQLVVELAEEGMSMTKHGQGFGSMSSPSKQLEALVVSHRLAHGGHPVARWCAANVAVSMDPAGNIKPAKDKSTGSIDGVVAALMALGRAIASPTSPGRSFWEQMSPPVAAA